MNNGKLHTANVANQYSQSNYKFHVSGDFNDKITVRSTSLLTDLKCSNDSTDFQINDRFPISPDTIPSVRLHALSKLYYNYVFKKIVIRYKTRQPTTKDGQVGLFFYDDPGEIVTSQPVSGYLLESMILEGQAGVIQPVYSNFTISYHGKPFRSSYRSSAQGGELQDAIQTNLCICSARPSEATIAEDSSYSLGLLEVDYELEFSRPKSLHPYSEAQLIPNYPLVIGSGNVGQSNDGSFAAWEISNSGPQQQNYQDFVDSLGVYMITLNETITGVNPTASWTQPLGAGLTYFMLVEWLPTTKVRLSIYTDYGALLNGAVMRSNSSWYTRSWRMNLHRIERFFDVQQNIGTPMLRKQLQAKVVQPETVSNGINQRVFVDPTYIETISPGQSRNLSSRL